LEQKGDFFHARKKCVEALKFEEGCPGALLCMARMALKIEQGDEAVQILREHPRIFQLQPEGVEASSIVAAAAEVACDWDGAANELERAARIAQRIGSAAQPRREDLLGRLARAQWQGGERDVATDTAQRVLDEFPMQREACEVACAVLLDRGDSATALAVMVRCVIGHRREPSRASADLVCGVMRRCSVEELMHVLTPQGAGSGEADPEHRRSVAELVGYIGLIMKERSEVLEACRLYRTACLNAPSNASLCLNLMHTYTLRRDDVVALAWALRYFGQLKATVHAAGRIWSILHGDIGDSISGSEGPCFNSDAPALSMGQFSEKSAFYDAIAIGFAVVKILYLAQPYLPIVSATAAEGGEAKFQTSLCLRRCVTIDIEAKGVDPRKVPFMDWEGTEIATKGHLRILRELCAVLDCSRKGLDLHLTPVRNEHAYFSCICQTIECLPLSSPAVAEERFGEPIFVVGDSHVLSNAWRTVFLPVAKDSLTRCHVLVPCVVTGAKIWHMREKSSFYTKFAFWERIDSLPSGAPVLLQLGEIDCREGVVDAVQKGRYPSVEMALRMVVDLYIEILGKVRRRLPRSKIFVHPVALVLPETRVLTLTFNQLLCSPSVRSALAKLNVELVELAPVFEGGAPDPGLGASDLSCLQLLPELQLDGTHMNPSYVKTHREPALAAAWKASLGFGCEG